MKTAHIVYVLLGIAGIAASIVVAVISRDMWVQWRQSGDERAGILLLSIVFFACLVSASAIVMFGKDEGKL